ncbi:hypothetical protein MBLNU457_1175t1 [Dothideomycetes sp. NU457]
MANPIKRFWNWLRNSCSDNQDDKPRGLVISQPFGFTRVENMFIPGLSPYETEELLKRAQQDSQRLMGSLQQIANTPPRPAPQPPVLPPIPRIGTHTTLLPPPAVPDTNTMPPMPTIPATPTTPIHDMMTSGSAATTRPSTGISGASTAVSASNPHMRNLSEDVKDGYAAETNSPTHKSSGRYQPLVAPKLEREEEGNDLVATGAGKMTLKEVQDEFGWEEKME